MFDIFDKLAQAEKQDKKERAMQVSCINAPSYTVRRNDHNSFYTIRLKMEGYMNQLVTSRTVQVLGIERHVGRPDDHGVLQFKSADVAKRCAHRVELVLMECMA